MNKNKVKFGLKNVYYALATIDSENNTATYGEPKRCPGAVAISLEPQGESSSFYADDGVYYATFANNGYEGDLELAMILDEFRADILGETADKNGVIVDDTAAEQKHFALLFEFSGDKSGRRHILYNCVASRPKLSSTTRGQSIEVQTESVTINAMPIHCEALKRDIVKANVDPDNAPYETWFTNVYEPENAA